MYSERPGFFASNMKPSNYRIRTVREWYRRVSRRRSLIASWGWMKQNSGREQLSSLVEVTVDRSYIFDVYIQIHLVKVSSQILSKLCLHLWKNDRRISSFKIGMKKLEDLRDHERCPLFQIKTATFGPVGRLRLPRRSTAMLLCNWSQLWVKNMCVSVRRP